MRCDRARLVLSYAAYAANNQRSMYPGKGARGLTVSPSNIVRHVQPQGCMPLCLDNGKMNAH